MRFLWNRRDLRACFITAISLSDIRVNCLAHVIALSKRSSVMEGKNLQYIYIYM